MTKERIAAQPASVERLGGLRRTKQGLSLPSAQGRNRFQGKLIWGRHLPAEHPPTNLGAKSINASLVLGCLCGDEGAVTRVREKHEPIDAYPLGDVELLLGQRSILARQNGAVVAA